MRKKRFKYKYHVVLIIGISLIILLFFFIKDNNVSFMKNISANILNSNTKDIFVDVTNAEIEELKKEINDLKELNKIDKLLSDKLIINAIVVKRSPNYWYNFITINKGEKEKVKKGYAVVSNCGLIGEVIAVNNHSSEVKLISGLNKKYISAKFTINDKTYYGIINKYDIKTNELLLNNVIGDIDDSIKDIDVVTTGFAGNMPSGILIGKIKKVIKDKYNLSNTIIIDPTSNLNNINIVRVIGND